MRKTWPLSWAIRVQFHHVVLNIAPNAIDAMTDSNEKQLRIRTHYNENDQVLVAFRQTGRGIDPSTMGKMFEPFYSTQFDGTGIRLSITVRSSGATAATCGLVPMRA